MVRSSRNANINRNFAAPRRLEQEVAHLRRRLHIEERHRRINEEYIRQYIRRANEREQAQANKQASRHAKFVAVVTANTNMSSRFNDLAQEHSDALDTLAEVDGCREEHDRRRRVLWQIKTRPDETLAQMSARAEIQREFIKSQRAALNA